MQIIRDGKLKLAGYIYKSVIDKGLNFYSEDTDSIQVGTWRYDEGERLADHVHNVVERKTWRTQEVIHVIRGLLVAYVYSERGKLIKKVYLEEQDTMIFWNGGHGYKILDDETIILEVKNGPFLGVDIDKRKF